MSEQKRERKLGEIFKRMIPLGILKEFFDEASDITVRLDRERRMMEVHCHLPKLYRKKDIYELEAAIAQTYELAQIRIFTHYEENLFSDAYMPEIFAEAARVGVVINGFFNRYTLRWEEDPKKLFIEIPFTHGGISLLDLARTGDRRDTPQRIRDGLSCNGVPIRRCAERVPELHAGTARKSPFPVRAHCGGGKTSGGRSGKTAGNGR